MMAVTDAQVATLRAMLADDSAQYGRLIRELDPDGLSTGFVPLVAAAFHQAARRRFGTADAAQVIEFVGEARARSAVAADRIDPRTAERLLLAARTEQDITDIGAVDWLAMQIRLLGALIADEAPSPAALDDALARARVFADRMVA